MKYAVYKPKLHKTSEPVDYRNADSPFYHRVELVYVGKADCMKEAKRLTPVPILESIENE
jgi:hypothetical protein